MKIKIGTRGSKLALHQTRQVIGYIKQQVSNCEIEEVIVKTLGDKVTDLPLFKVGGQGLFIKEIEQALIDGRIDMAVHSLKDVPHEIATGLTLAAYGMPQDPRDCFLSKKFESLQQMPAGSIIGTSSLRRRAQISALRPDLSFSDFRGNLDTRLQKLENGEVDAIILAAAGLLRFDQAHKINEYFSINELTPPAGQGLITVQCRSADIEAFMPMLDSFACEKSKARALCERAFLEELQGGCQTPMAIHATIRGNELVAHSFIGAVDASKTLRRNDSGPLNMPEHLGKKVAAALIAAGGLELLAKNQEDTK